MGRGFEFVGGTIVPLGMGAPVAMRILAEDPDAVANMTPIGSDSVDDALAMASVAMATPAARRATVTAAPVRGHAAPAPTKPMNVVREAKRRLAEINRQLRDMRKLEREGAELRRLIAAAKEKPKAVVRSIARTAS